ncbi:SIR2 family protein [Desulfotruncus arcticus]|uniref:SIR2 family protein n=1 Tax=Desulfotruncus arcticus TaxID=341036 RepID=UPI00307F6725
MWTTNYDTLLERAFSEFLVDAKVNDDAISRNVVNSDIEILKIHGCISRSHHKDIIITQEDYEDFLIKRPAMSQRLCNDLLKKSFLFIGYSYRDPNIRNIMIEARRLAQKTTQEHYLITAIPKDDNPEFLVQKKRRQELWCKDLKRLGISTLLIENHDQLEKILFAISQKSRGKTIYVTGSHEKNSRVAQQLGKLLAKENEIILISGQSTGIGSNVVSAFTEQCINDKQDIHGRLQIFPNPYAANPNFSNDPALLPDLKRCRSKLMNSTQVVIAFSGGMGTEAEIEVAKNRNCKIVPVVLDNNDLQNKVIKKVLDDAARSCNLNELPNEYYNKLMAGGVSAEDVMACIKIILR